MKNENRKSKIRKSKIVRGTPSDFRNFYFWIPIVRQVIHWIKLTIYNIVTIYLWTRVKCIAIDTANCLFKKVTWLASKVNHSKLVKLLVNHVIEIFPNFRKSISKKNFDFRKFWIVESGVTIASLRLWFTFLVNLWFALLSRQLKNFILSEIPFLQDITLIRKHYLEGQFPLMLWFQNFEIVKKKILKNFFENFRYLLHA